MWYDDLVKSFESNKNDKESGPMAAYMKNNFKFLGIKKPIREALMKPYFKEQRKRNEIDWDFVNSMYNKEYREFLYLALDYLHSMKKYIKPSDLDRIKELILKHSWWDSIDSISDIVYESVSKDHGLKNAIIQYSKDPNLWLRRTSILYQRKAKENTDLKILEETITNNFFSDEFFINKAIGWALREYAKTDPIWVKEFVEKHSSNLSTLSIREALKHF